MPTSDENAIANQDSTFAQPGQKTTPSNEDYGLVSRYDLHLFNEGTHTRLYEKFGSHVTEIDGKQGSCRRRSFRGGTVVDNTSHAAFAC